MLANISTISLDTLYQNEESFDNFYDVFLVSSEKDYHETQVFLEQNNTLVFITLEEADLISKQVLVKAIYEAVMDEPADSDNVRQNIEAIEEELDEVNCCVLGLPVFYNCDAETQAELLELPIVSEAFKLLLYVDSNAFSENLSLWKVLLSRSLVIDGSESSEYSTIDKSSVYEAAIDEDLEPEPDTNTEAPSEKAWYQMIPKYHLATALVLFFVILALWNMDLTKTKEEPVFLGASSQTKAQLTKTEEQLSENKQIRAVQTNAEGKNSQRPDIGSMDDKNAEADKKARADESRIETSDSKALIIEEVRPKDAVEQQNEPAVVEPVSKENTAKENNKPAFYVDWSPYQSYQWIKGLNKEYFTLQLMASHSEKGVRDFLKERGVSSQYAVYTIEKDGKPWHIIIYGVYQTRDFANRARQDLPPYLKAHSPWIRPFADIQAALP